MSNQNKELVKAFVVGALLFGVLSIARAPYSSRDGLEIVGGYPGLVAVAAVIGGISGVLFVQTASWRRSGGLKRSAAYALIGAVIGAFLFVVLVSDGGSSLGLAGRPLSAWVSGLLGSSAMVAVAALISRKWFDFIGVLKD